MRCLLLAAAVALGGCELRGQEAWQEVRIDLPGDTLDVVYGRKPLPNAWVGTEQYRRLRRGTRVANLAVQMGGREPVNVYLRRDSSRTVLQFEESDGTISVDLATLDGWADGRRADTLGTFVGVLRSPEIRDLRFVPAAEGPPARLD